MTQLTPTHLAAVEFIHANPGATTFDIAEAAGAPMSVQARAADAALFLAALIQAGLVQVVPTPGVRHVLDNEAPDADDAVAQAVHQLLSQQ